ncbi:hypothetical protein AGR4A_pAt10103 [Agrobacterium tumefaciens str. B6]|uniref:Uncharacterized protein n=1 Tax=Agrobacterium tumefaciens str. B6 TaxID=1183423 RepID=A0A822V807_AGRTU|nr:hypothetical protein AGR4A_pAt10103 [Agrobacterium tumefaciens str. B6]
MDPRPGFADYVVSGLSPLAELPKTHIGWWVVIEITVHNLVIPLLYFGEFPGLYPNPPETSCNVIGLEN